MEENGTHRYTVDGLRKELSDLIEVVKNNILLEASFGVELCNVHIDKGNTQCSQPEITPPPLRNREPSVQQATMESPKVARLRELQETASKCVKCGLHKTRTNVVFGVGNPDANLMFVGEAPGYYEDVQGEPFVGRAGQLLTKIINAIGMQREEVYIANILKCRPPDNRNPLPDEIVLCSPYLRNQIEIIQPKIICALGAFAAQTLLSTKQSIGSLRGKFHDYQGIKLIPTYHPAYLLRNPGDKRKTWEDMKKVRDALKE